MEKTKEPSKQDLEKNRLLAVIPEIELFGQGHRACAGCGVALAARHILKAAGPNTIAVNATGCLEVFTTPYPQSAWKIPWIHGAFENAAAIGSGIAAVMKKKGLKHNLLVFGGDGGTFDIGLQALSGAIERGHKLCYICVDNEAYMNTGIQRSGSTEKYTATTTTPAGKVVHGKKEFKKDLVLMLPANHKNAYIATANVAEIPDLIRKVRKALAHDGPSYIQVYTPCTPGWKIADNMTIEVSKKAIQAKVTPLFEIENGILKLNKKIENPIPLVEYLKLQGRFKHMNSDEIKDLENHINERYNRIAKLDELKLKVW